MAGLTRKNKVCQVCNGTNGGSKKCCKGPAAATTSAADAASLDAAIAADAAPAGPEPRGGSTETVQAEKVEDTVVRRVATGKSGEAKSHKLVVSFPDGEEWEFGGKIAARATYLVVVKNKPATPEDSDWYREERADTWGVVAKVGTPGLKGALKHVDHYRPFYAQIGHIKVSDD